MPAWTSSIAGATLKNRDSLIDMKSIGTTICLAVVTATLIAASPTHASKVRRKSPTGCGTRHGHIIVGDSRAIVYREIERFGTPAVFGCTYIGRRPYRLGVAAGEIPCSSQGCGGIEHETLAGPFTAYESSFSGIESGTFLVIVRDLRNGRVLHQAPTGVPFPPDPLVTGNGPISSISLKADGSVAWITVDSVGEATHYEVHALDKTGNRLLATGTDIDPHSLALAGSTLYWTQSDKPYSTPLN
jgi:hypothetical protein